MIGVVVEKFLSTIYRRKAGGTEKRLFVKREFFRGKKGIGKMFTGIKITKTTKLDKFTYVNQTAYCAKTASVVENPVESVEN